MRKFAIALCVLVLLLIVGSYNVWRATEDPVISKPTLLQIGRAQLHAQLLDAEQREAQIEKQDWNSPDKLRALVKAHQDRIQKLLGNGQAAEIFAYDHAAVDRLQKRIAELEAQQAAQPPTPSVSQPEHVSPAQH
jgi:hypothetical protein